jgi:hypothetical protein
VILGDTGEGDRSQYSLLPLLWAAKPDFMIINGDVAYPAGEPDDFQVGFFNPYHNMGIPIWATAGNHEYYSGQNGREFYDVFCTRTCSKQWSDAGLRLVPQPGMYWELREPSGETPLVVIGLDSGKKGNLDGHKGTYAKITGQAQRPDAAQHAWLDSRLALADARGDTAIILFHIPSLVSGKKDDVHLHELHRVIAKHPSVRLVVCGHIHNHQEYEPAVFRRYMANVCQAPPGPHAPPHYIVNGNGGATIDGTARFDPALGAKPEYELKAVFPPGNRWKEETKGPQRVAAAFGSSTFITRAIGAAQDAGRPDDDTSATTDTDPAAFQSFLVVDVAPPAIDVSLVAMERLSNLFTQQPADRVIKIEGPSAGLLDPTALADCTRHLLTL